MLTLSLNAHASILDMFKWLPLALAYFLTIYAVRNQAQLVGMIWLLCLLGLFQAGYGMLQTYGGAEQIWYFVKTAYQGYITGTYVSRNQLAYYLESMALTGLGTALGLYLRIPAELRTLNNERIWKILLLGFTSVILAVTLLLTGSRGGIISFAVSLCAMALLLVSRRVMRRAGLGILIMALVTVIYGMGAGLEKTAARFERVSDLQHRLDIATSVLPMIADYPLTGVGFGMFNTAYDPYALPNYGSRIKASHAHNDWVEIAAETGLPGLLICLSGYFLFLGRCLAVWRQRRHPLILGLGAGILCALLSIGIHSFFDFGMRVPANVLTVGILCGLLWTALHMDGRRSLQRHLPTIELNRKRSLLALAGFVSLFTGMLLFTWSALQHDRAERLCPVQRTIYPSPPPTLDRILAARRLAPDVPEYMVEQAWRQATLVREGRVGPGMIMQSATLLKEALQQDPANGLYWRDYANLLAYCTQYSFGQSLEPTTELAFHRARALRPHDGEITLSEANYRLQFAGQQASLKAGLELLAETVRLAPSRWKIVVEIALRYTQNPVVLFKLVEPVHGRWAQAYIRKKLKLPAEDQKKE